MLSKLSRKLIYRFLFKSQMIYNAINVQLVLIKRKSLSSKSVSKTGILSNDYYNDTANSDSINLTLL